MACVCLYISNYSTCIIYYIIIFSSPCIMLFVTYFFFHSLWSCLDSLNDMLTKINLPNIFHAVKSLSKGNL